MQRVTFNPGEITGEIKNGVPVLNTPCTPRENMLNMFAGKNPVYMPMLHEQKNYTFRQDPDNIARGLVMDGGVPLKTEEKGGKDMFGLEWVFVPTVGGSIVRPGKPLMSDANEWKDLIQFPDVTKWDWEGCAEMNKNILSNDMVNSVMMLNGFMFERLISFMDFEAAAMALLDEDQVDAVIEFSNAMCDKIYIPYLECIKKYLPNTQMVHLHDDWGSQMNSFFSLSVAREVYVPVMRKFADKCHELGLLFQIHSCGKNEKNIPAFIEGGVDTWNGMYMNDKKGLYEKYGDRFVFAVDGPLLHDSHGNVSVSMPYVAQDMNASKEEMYAAAKEVCDYYIRDGKCHVVANTFRANPYFIEGIYYYSRQMLNN